MILDDYDFVPKNRTITTTTSKEAYSKQSKFYDKVTRTTSPNDDFGRVVTYRNRKGEEYTRI